MWSRTTGPRPCGWWRATSIGFARATRSHLRIVPEWQASVRLARSSRLLGPVGLVVAVAPPTTVEPKLQIRRWIEGDPGARLNRLVRFEYLDARHRAIPSVRSILGRDPHGHALARRRSGGRFRGGGPRGSSRRGPFRVTPLGGAWTEAFDRRPLMVVALTDDPIAGVVVRLEADAGRRDRPGSRHPMVPSPVTRRVPSHGSLGGSDDSPLEFTEVAGEHVPCRRFAAPRRASCRPPPGVRGRLLTSRAHRRGRST